MRDRIIRNGVEVFDSDIGGIVINNPQPIFKVVPSYNYYDALRERADNNPIAFNKFLSQSLINTGLWG